MSLSSIPLERVTLRDEASRRLRSEIVSAQLEPATLYPIAEVAQRLGVSITPVREALLELARDGLVEIVRNRGFRIREVTEQDLDEIVHLRLLLEVPTVAGLAGKLSTEDLASLRVLAEATIDAARRGDIPTYLQLDKQFHLELLAHAGSRRIVETVAKLRDETRLYGLGRLAGTPELIATTSEHLSLLDALAKGDAKLATALLTEHLHHARGVWSQRS